MDVYRAHWPWGHRVKKTDKTRVFIQLSMMGRHTASSEQAAHRLITDYEAKISQCWDTLRGRDDGPLSSVGREGLLQELTAELRPRRKGASQANS